MLATIKIAHWTFAPETGVLENGEGSTRLEHRTAALLELLARNPGQLVSHSEIIDAVWDGRTVSPNSVAVVISDIRRALGDDPKAPKYVETLPKRGYRLIANADGARVADPDALEPDSMSRRLPWLAFAALALIAVLAFAFGRNFNAQPPVSERLSVNVADVVNETGDVQYDPLTASVTELLAVELARQDAMTMVNRPDATVIVSGKLILWDGHPSMSIHAQSVATGEVIWSGMASGPETLLPRQVRTEISEFSDFVEADAEND